MAGRPEKKEDDEGEHIMPFQNMEKGIVLQETRIFGDTPLNVRKCCHLLTKVLFLVARGDDLTTKEATDVFFSITKLFQSQDVFLRRLVFLTLKELTPMAEDVIIVISSLTKDMNSPIEVYRSNAIRVLCKILTDISLLGQGERHLKQAILDKEPTVASAALVSGIHLLKHQSNFELVKRWVNEIQEAVKSRNHMVQYHALGLMYQIKKHDRLAIIKLLSTVRKNAVRSPYANCLLIRYTTQLLRESPPSDDILPFYEYLGSCLRNTSEMVMYEAARSLTVNDFPGLPQKLLSSAFAVLNLFLTTPKTTLRFAAIRTLSEVALKHPKEVQMCNKDIERLIKDPNRNIATLAITTLLKTGDLESVDVLITEISSFMSELSDEFKVVLVNAIRTLCSKYPQKYRTLIVFLFEILREDGGYSFKKSILDTILSIMRDVPESKELGLSCVCEYIEDCEYVQLSVLVLNVIGREGPFTSVPSRYIRYIYNRVILESAAVRASAVQALAQFGLHSDSLRPSILTLLKSIMLDSDDEVRDRATFYHSLISKNDSQVLKDVLAELPIMADELERSLLDYQNTSCDQPFDLDSAIAVAIAERPVRRAQESQDEKEESGGFSGALSTKPASVSQISSIPEFASYGKLFKSCNLVKLTEDTVEYTVSCVKHIFSKHVVFEFIISNTVQEQELENVGLKMEIEAEDDLLHDLVPDVEIEVKLLPFDAPASSYVSFVRDPSTFPTGVFSTALSFIAHNLDSEGIREDDEGEEDEYPLEELEVAVGDYMLKASIPNFQDEWEKSDSFEAVETFALNSVRTIQDAVNEILECLSMQPCDKSEEVPANKSKHILYASGVWVSGILVLARARMRLNPQTQNVDMELTVRSSDENVNQIVCSAI